jgi:hypothetical protein
MRYTRREVLGLSAGLTLAMVAPPLPLVAGRPEAQVCPESPFVPFKPWIGSANILFIPLIIEGRPEYDPPPADFLEIIQRRVFFDPDPDTGEDGSITAYISTVSHGLASINATVSEPVTITEPSGSPTLLAINAHPDAHLYEYLAVVYPPGPTGGQAQPGRINFFPPRTPNFTKARSRFRFDESLGTWAHEIMHNVVDMTDLYNNFDHPGRFDPMASSDGAHPTAYTKLQAGWYRSFALHRGRASTYTLHAVGLSSKPQERVRAVKVQADGSDRYLIIEARLKSDQFESGFFRSSGIPSEGVVIYEFAPRDDPWPHPDTCGPWSPLELRTDTALSAGQRFWHHDTWTSAAGPRDERSGVGRYRLVTVKKAVAGGFVVDVTVDLGPVGNIPPLEAVLHMMMQ